MALNTARQGHVHPPFTYEVGRAKVREYARATGAGDPALVDDPPGTPTPCPPTFLAAMLIAEALPTVVDDPELGATWDLLHTAQSLDLHRAVRVGDVLRCTPRVARAVPRGRMDLLEVAVDVTDDRDGAPVATATSTVVVFARDEPEEG